MMCFSAVGKKGVESRNVCVSQTLHVRAAARKGFNGRQGQKGVQGVQWTVVFSPSTKLPHRDAGGSLVDLLHLGALVVVVLERRQLVHVVRLVVVLDGEAELDHAVDARGEGGRLLEREARGEERRLEEEVDQVLDRLPC